jgi:hypothetical protein
MACLNEAQVERRRAPQRRGKTLHVLGENVRGEAWILLIDALCEVRGRCGALIFKAGKGRTL